MNNMNIMKLNLFVKSKVNDKGVFCGFVFHDVNNREIYLSKEQVIQMISSPQYSSSYVLDITYKGGKFYFVNRKKKITDLPVIHLSTIKKKQRKSKCVSENTSKVKKNNQSKSISTKGKGSLNQVSKNILSHDGKNVYIMVEDAVSGVIFWRWLCENKLYNVNVKDFSEHPNNETLVKAVENLTEDGNIYIVLLDISFNNQYTLDYYDRLQKVCFDDDNNRKKKNVFLVENYYGLESVFLTFNKCAEWVGKRKKLKKEEILLLNFFNYSFRNNLNPINDNTMMDMLRKMAQKNAKLNNSEEVCTVFLQILYSHNKGFKVSKDEFGDCWKEDCCYNSYLDCGLGLSKKTKATELYENTYLKYLIEESGVLNVTNLY